MLADRALGARIGARVEMDDPEIDEPDLVSIGDDVEIEHHARFGTASLVDGYLELGTIEVGPHPIPCTHRPCTDEPYALGPCTLVPPLALRVPPLSTPPPAPRPPFYPSYPRWARDATWERAV